MYPSEFRYTREHEWVKVDGDLCVLGITEFAQSELGEVVFVELPEVGHLVDAGAEIGSIESVKAVAEVYTPVAGEIVELNEDPHGEGWLIKLRFSSSSDFDELMDAEAYEAYTKEGK